MPARRTAPNIEGVRAGSIGLSGCFSFYPGKNLGACGEGGIVVTSDDDQMKTMRMLRDWGQEQRYHHVLKGFNYRMDGIQGAVLRDQAAPSRRLDRGAAAACAALFGTAGRIGACQVPVEAVGPSPRLPYLRGPNRDRDGLQRSLQAQGVQTGLHYPIPVHLQKAHARPWLPGRGLPAYRKRPHEVLSLPIYPEMTERQVRACGGRGTRSHARRR